MLKNCAAKIDLPHFLFFHNSINYADHNCIQIFFVAKKENKKDSMNWRDKKIYYILFSSRSLEVEATTTRKFIQFSFPTINQRGKFLMRCLEVQLREKMKLQWETVFQCVSFFLLTSFDIFPSASSFISIVSSGSFIYISYYI